MTFNFVWGRQGYRAGASFADQGRYPAATAQAVRKVVHEGFTGTEAYEFYQEAIE